MLPYRQEFLATQKSPSTLRMAGAALAWLDRYIGNAHRRLDDFPPWLAAQGLAPSTRMAYLLYIRSYLRWLRSNGRPHVSEHQWFLFHRQVEASCRRPLPCSTQENLCHLIDAWNPHHEGKRLRDVAILETLRATGCRVREVVRLERRHLDGGRARIGNDYVYFDCRAWEALEDYLGATEDGDGPLFGVTAQTVWELVKRAGENVGLDVTPKDFRRAFRGPT